MTEDRDAYLDRVLIGEREPVSITVVEYDQRWPQHFRKNAEQIRAVLGPRALSTENHGRLTIRSHCGTLTLLYSNFSPSNP